MSSTGETALGGPGLLPVSEAVTPPAPLDRLVDSFREVEVVVPQPRYPPVLPSFMPALSSKLPGSPTAGKRGSWLGLKRYSSISCFRSSSAIFLAFRFLHHHSRTRMIKATEATGTTTATAIVPAAERPPEPESPGEG